MRKAILGDSQSITLEFPEAKAGEVWEVDIKVVKPDGSQLAFYQRYKFYKPITAPKESS